MRSPSIWRWSILFACCIAPMASRADSRRELWNNPTTPFAVIGNIYYVGTAGLAAYLITTPQGHVLLDGCLPESAEQIKRNITALGFELRDIKYLLNSHAHYDHSGGLAELKAATGAKLIASEGDKSALEGGFYLGSNTDHSLDAPPVKVDRVIQDRAQVSLGGTTLTANATPGHTRGCTSWSMPVQAAGTTYQVLFFCSATVAANRLVAPPQYPGIVSDYEHTFAKVRKLKVDVFLAPHPEFFHMREKRERLGQSELNPFVDPGEFRLFIDRAEESFRKDLAQQRAAAKPTGSSSPPPR